MKPWPQKLRELFPGTFDADTHPTRPWWVWGDLSNEARAEIQAKGFALAVRSRWGWIRSDGVTIGSKDDNDRRNSRREAARDFDVVDAFDAAQPLPRPLFRPSQVWANADGYAVTIVSTSKEGRAFYAGYIPSGLRDIFTVGVAELSDPERFPYLVADPLYPDAAPWSAP